MKGILGVFSQSIPLAQAYLWEDQYRSVAISLKPHDASGQISYATTRQHLIFAPFLLLCLKQRTPLPPPYRYSSPKPYLLYLTCGYVSKERLSFREDHIIASILKHSNGYQVLPQPGHIHNILQGEWIPMLPLKSNHTQSSNTILPIVTHPDMHLEIFLL